MCIRDRDISETIDVAAKHPDIVAEILSLGDNIRTELGDTLLDKVGTGTRLAGEIE